MKKIIISCVVLFAAFSADAQKSKPVSKNKDIVITPGVGVGPLKLGMSEKQAFAILGGKITWKNYDKELSVFKGYGNGFSIDSITQFIIGFDNCGAYGGDLPKVLPVYSLYFTKHKLNYITVTSFGTTDALTNRVVLKNGIRFYDDMSDCMDKMKTKYISIKYDNYDGDHIYYTEGLEFTYDGQKLTTIGVFKPAPDFLKKIADKRDALLEEFGNVE